MSSSAAALHDVAQGSDDWREARSGLITASRFADVIAVRRDGKPTAARAKYLRLLAFERLANAPVREIHSRSMEWGTELETFAREAYELETGRFVTQAGLVIHPEHPFIGCSPDGLIGADGGLEIKCPHDETVHIGTWLDGMPADHLPQVQGAMFVTGREWWDFVSYDPRQAEHLNLYVQRISRDQDYIDALEIGLLQFEAELQQLVEELKGKGVAR